MKPPEKLYLQWDNEGGCDESTWCQDQINDDDIEYKIVNNAAIPQPPPMPGKQIVADMVIEDIQARVVAGEKKYGTKLMTHNGRDALMDLYQELIDAVLYCKQLIEERKNTNV